MIVEMQEFISEQSRALADQAGKFRRNPSRFTRKALADSAEGFKSLKSPVRVVAHSAVKLTVVSQKALQSLIELQSEVVTSALSGAAKRFEQAARAEDILDLVRDQTDMLPATRDRVVDEATRAVAIVTDAGRDVRKLAMHTYEGVVKAGEVKRAPRKAAAARPATRKTVARRRRKVAKRIPPASAWSM